MAQLQFNSCNKGQTCYIGDGETEFQYTIIEKMEDMKRLLIQRSDEGSSLAGSRMIVAACDIYFK